MEFLNNVLSADNIDNQCDSLEKFTTQDNLQQVLSSQNEFHLVKSLGNIFNLYSFKRKAKFYPVGQKLVEEIINTVNPWVTPNIAEELVKVIKTQAGTKTKEYAYLALEALIQKNPTQIKICMPYLIPIVSSDVHDVSPNVKQNSVKVLELLLKCSGNGDLDVFIPVVLKGIVSTSTIGDAVEALASCVFVQNVEAPALAVAYPILTRGLNDPKTATKRKACVIIDNMCQLIEHPKEILPFYKKLKEMLDRCNDMIADPEARNVSNRALNTLKSCCVDENAVFYKTPNEFNELLLNEFLKEGVNFDSNAGEESPLVAPPVPSSECNGSPVEYLSYLVTNMCNSNYFDEACWNNIFSAKSGVDNQEVLRKVQSIVYTYAKETFVVKEDIYKDTEEGKNLYQGSFSLAYGALTLLNNTHLHLKQNRFYGLLGPNNCGKTTLMRAIANEQIEGFPKKDELKTIFVEHEIPEMEVGEDEKGFPILNIDLNGVEWVVHCCNHIYNTVPAITNEQVESVMEGLGFGHMKKGVGMDKAADMGMPITTYSGGWKVKMQLCAATLVGADIIMLDEPTGHLDVNNVLWIKDWLRNFRANGGSIIATSHDPVFLNEMCTHVIDFQNRKLKMFSGEFGKVLEGFVEQFPEKKGYFELKNDVVKFVFPDPGPLENIKSMSKGILKMKGVTFTYPTRTVPTIYDVDLECSRISRVGVIGANGAGKSTAIKILIGELKTKPGEGEVTKFPGMRLAYIAQHAFHHLEKHLHKTPTQYIMWRFAGNEDKEGLDMIGTGVDTEAEQKAVKYFINTVDGTVELKMCYLPSDEKKAVEPELILGRRENKKEKTKEYEVKWKNIPQENSMWVTREILIKMGSSKMVQRHDEKEAVMAGLASKTLTTKDIQKHFANFGISDEQANHTLIKSLSGGQKVKVVLAASLWQNPHLVILDEPTNYLDRDGLGALTNAIHDFKGGVVIISHNKEFTNAVTQEKWIMEKGRLRKEGESVSVHEEDKNKMKNQDEVVFDSFGNEIKVDKKINLSDKEKKREIKDLKKKLANGKKKKILTEDECYEIENKIAVLEGKDV